MNRADRRRWAEACTLADLGELTALWLEGRIASQPGYQPNCGPEEETLPLVSVLARLNRAGYVTVSSQPGQPPTLGYDGRLWRQRAAVEGFCDTRTVDRLTAAVAGTGLLLIQHRAVVSPWWRRWAPCGLFGPTGGEGAVVVTTAGGQPHTWFGRRIPSHALRFIAADVGAEAFQAISTAWQVSVIDPEWGRDDLLWDLLDRAATIDGGGS